MRKQLFELVKTDIELSKEEVLSLYNPESFELFNNILIIRSDKDFSDRLALTKRVFDVLEENPDWTHTIKGSFKVICRTNRTLEKEIAGRIFSSIKDPRVDLKNPDTAIEIFEVDNETMICKIRRTVSTDWKDRKPHMKPELSPTSLNPRIAKAMINISGMTSGTLCDPFCGTGGILVEGGLMDYSLIGLDIDNICLKKARINLKHYNIEDFRLIHEDALNNTEKFDAVVTDLPYGLNTKVNGTLDELYKEFFKTYSKLCNSMVVGLPSNIDIKDYLTNWNIEKEFIIYLHKSLSKRILKLSRIHL